MEELVLEGCRRMRRKFKMQRGREANRGQQCDFLRVREMPMGLTEWCIGMNFSENMKIKSDCPRFRIL